MTLPATPRCPRHGPLAALSPLAQNDRPCRALDRTIQEQFVDYHEDQLFHDLPGFNRKLANWLLDCNTVLPHHSLGLQSPATSSSIINLSAKGVDLYTAYEKPGKSIRIEA